LRALRSLAKQSASPSYNVKLTSADGFKNATTQSFAHFFAMTGFHHIIY